MSDWEIVRLGPDYTDLARYNAEVARGIIHTQSWAEQMADLQSRFDAERRNELIEEGYRELGNGAWICDAPLRRRRWWRRG